MASRTWLVLRAMAREEHRLHAALFGGQRFGAVPVFVAVASAATVGALQFTGTDAAAIADGARVLALAFGLYTGTAGLVGDDLLERALGETEVLLSTAGYLPLSRRRLLGAFLVKDAAYYAVLFLLPICAGFAPLVATGALAPAALGSLWVSLLVAFVVGMVATFAAIAARTRGVPSWALGVVVAGGAGAVWATGNAAAAWNAVVATSFLHALAVLAAALAAGAAALAVYVPTHRDPAETRPNQFGPLADAIGDENGLVARTLLDLARSSGGLLKPVVSAAILLALAAFLVDVAARIVGVTPKPGVFFGTVLALSAFTTYNWLTQFDSVEEYLLLPVSVPAVFRAKRTAFLLTGLPTSVAAYVVVLAIYDVSLVDAAVGLALLGGLSVYLFGVTVALAGFDPNEFLFDVRRFALFTAGVAVPLVPVLLVAFATVSGPISGAYAGTLVAASAALAAVGVGLSRRAGPRWAAVYAAG
ncbi:uncharacterized protein HHUB_2491 [Halobacterium hubeiense]|uniref:ABC-2 type transport system permease protein n=1 Tax=Halobacterium hubeiense TaxID=1407499 RepID=A0A0U5H0M8_9EURY|nr:hypothetical protein [Halobacterium hubeiense]CQH57170.1 uncharacterized protein HHUB_2491 [Halobacterium hubeiense]